MVTIYSMRRKLNDVHSKQFLLIMLHAILTCFTIIAIVSIISVVFLMKWYNPN